MRAKGAQSNKDETAYRGKYQHKSAGHVLPYNHLLFVTKTKFFLFARRFRQYPLPEGGYFTQFSLTVMTNEIKRILTDQNIIKRADQPAGLDLGLGHHIIGGATPCP